MAVVVFLVWISIVNPSVVAEEEDKGHTLRDGQNEGISPTVLDYQYYSTLVRRKNLGFSIIAPKRFSGVSA